MLDFMHRPWTWRRTAWVVYNYLLSCGTYEAGRYATWNQRDGLAGFGPIRATNSMGQQLLCYSLCCSILVYQFWSDLRLRNFYRGGYFNFRTVKYLELCTSNLY